MREDFETEAETPATSVLETAAHTERDLAQGVTRWLLANFGAELADAVASSPFDVPLLCAIACKEAGAYWLPLTPRRPPGEILGLCVYDASGDVAGAPRSAFPVNTTQFRRAYGETFTGMLVAETNKARAARGLAAAEMVYKGYGIFQYDLQHVRADEAFFRERKWYSFRECVKRAVGELKEKYQATHDVEEAVRAYNGSGPRARQYLRDVMRLLPYCEEATASHRTSFAAVESVQAAPRFSPVDDVGVAGADDDPAAPQEDEVNEVADLEAARFLANLGTPSTAGAGPEFAIEAAPLAADGLIALDIGRAKAFLAACRNAHPRVTYGLGAKVPFHGAVPGRDFAKVDCSGFVREAIRLSTSPRLAFPDGSVVQHDWVRARGLRKSTITDGARSDGLVRIAFLRPQDSPSRIGHVVLISDGMTLESHGGVGPDARVWDGGNWQAKAYVYVLARATSSAASEAATPEAAGREAALAGFAATAPVAELASLARMAAPSFTVRTGRRYRATVSLGGWEMFASNDQVAEKLAEYGFVDIVVTGYGTTRQAEATWNGPDITAAIDPHLSNVVELPAVAGGRSGGAKRRAPQS